nr:hypothetical protein [Tanacetum cinerariifolium]
KKKAESLPSKRKNLAHSIPHGLRLLKSVITQCNKEKLPQTDSRLRPGERCLENGFAEWNEEDQPAPKRRLLSTVVNWLMKDQYALLIQNLNGGLSHHMSTFVICLQQVATVKKPALFSYNCTRGKSVTTL